ncbi:MAG: glutaminase [Planctomycetes bacterium]|nr:glutaminase [Planctomycetota bacterium]MCB9910948.1 glutaminase [Planctomycetota bacterium]MCB9911585.1 glutaminase [Planctomycetota bacterium]HPF13544.1 glutaminase [Planctomycetota bacterium]HRV80828.1 glutaminase [Planctomycetota bacterium]
MDWDSILKQVERAVRPHRGAGRVATYIPALAQVDPQHFGLAIAFPDGTVHTLGDAHERFSIQSISKVFTLTLALREVGDRLWERVGREPSGSAFHSIVQLESERGIPRNPLINAGAIVTTDHLVALQPPGDDPASGVMAQLLELLRRLAEDPSIAVDPVVAQSEAQTGSRNRALAHFMASFGNMAAPVEQTLAAYFRHCAISMNCVQLARAARFLACDGVDPISGTPILSEQGCRRVNAVMMACGHYDNSGDFAYRIGLPGKSGVGGGILAVAPKRAAIAVWSPGLNAAGTSMVGGLALEELVRATGWSVFG